LPVVASAPEGNPPDYLRINPSGALPALRAGDTVVTEIHAILVRGPEGIIVGLAEQLS